MGTPGTLADNTKAWAARVANASLHGFLIGSSAALLVSLELSDLNVARERSVLREALFDGLLSARVLGESLCGCGVGCGRRAMSAVAPPPPLFVVFR